MARWTMEKWSTARWIMTPRPLILRWIRTMTTRPSRFALIALGVSLSAAAGGTANAAEMMDHSMHQTPPAEAAQAPASSAKPAAKNHGSGGQTDHSAMGHSAMDHSTMTHGQMKHDKT